MKLQKQANFENGAANPGNNQNVSQILKQRIKDYQEMIKITSQDGT